MCKGRAVAGRRALNVTASAVAGSAFGASPPLMVTSPHPSRRRRLVPRLHTCKCVLQAATSLIVADRSISSLAADSRREWPLAKYRNIGIMAHIDAGKVQPPPICKRASRSCACGTCSCSCHTPGQHHFATLLWKMCTQRVASLKHVMPRYTAGLCPVIRLGQVHDPHGC